jgi:hypothetical protein
MMHEGFKFRSAIAVAALAAVLAGGTFFYAGHSTVAHSGSSKAISFENALQEIPAATGIDTTSALMW